ncbi:hypothetical protein A6K26_009195 [Gammaproteobacteria bacterium 2W06]|nr:hypothetical protein A6K26_009195 [Gammaproteobacteria bacterium 2W06]
MGRQAGLTLIEIVFVIGVLGVLATFAVQGLGGNQRATDLLEAEDKVVAEIRRARSQAIYQLSPEGGDNETIADLQARVGGQIAVCPEEVVFRYDTDGSFRFGAGDIGGIIDVKCGGCGNFDDTSPYTIRIESGTQTRTLIVNDDTGRVER